jgi:hypothetical protein
LTKREISDKIIMEVGNIRLLNPVKTGKQDSLPSQEKKRAFTA